jgi:uncharacterized protein YqhQ
MQATFFGGQAVMEGVMMRGRHCMAVAVRTPDGQIALHVEPLSDWRVRLPIAGWPLVRGVLLLADTLRLGMKALLFSARVAEARTPPALPGDAELRRPLAVSLALAVGFLFVLPLVVVLPLDGLITVDLASTLLEGGIRLGLLVGYLRLIGRLPEVERLFGYHGAEHQTINAYEAGADLTPAGVRRFGLTHPRCGTGFLLIVVLLSVVVFALLGRPPLPLRLAARILLLPVIAAVAYEYLRLTATLYRRRLGRWLAAPGLALQRLTTRPPDDGMREVAIAALQHVLAGDRALTPAVRRARAACRADEPGAGHAPLTLPDG